VSTHELSALFDPLLEVISTSGIALSIIVDRGNGYEQWYTNRVAAAMFGYTVDEYSANAKASRVPEGFCYNSGTNPQFLTVEEIRTLIRRHVQPDFAA